MNLNRTVNNFNREFELIFSISQHHFMHQRAKNRHCTVDNWQLTCVNQHKNQLICRKSIDSGQFDPKRINQQQSAANSCIAYSIYVNYY